MKKPRVMYLPTLDGRPARFDGNQLCFVDASTHGRFNAVLLPSLTEVRRQIKATRRWRRKEMYREDWAYHYVRVEVST